MCTLWIDPSHKDVDSTVSIVIEIIEQHKFYNTSMNVKVSMGKKKHVMVCYSCSYLLLCNIQLTTTITIKLIFCTEVTTRITTPCRVLYEL